METDIFIRGKNLNLIVLSEETVKNSNWHKWFNSEKTTRFMQKHYFPNTIQKQIAFVKEINSTDKIVLGIHSKNELIGVCSIDEINHYNRTCTLSIIIGEKTNNEILSIEVFYLLAKHSFDTLNLNKIKIGQHEHLKLFTSKLNYHLGFKEEGVLKNEIYKNGKYYDVILSALFKNDFNDKLEHLISYING
jgi:RimJ/RimL family protein N-acetyltransferase